MPRELVKKVISISALVAFGLGAGCIGSAEPNGNNGGSGGIGGSGGSGGAGGGSDMAVDPLSLRTVNYGAALRSAALKLTGNLPTLDEISAVASATGVQQKAAYEAQIDLYLKDPRFVRQVFSYFEHMMKMGGTINVPVGNPAVQTP